jgi:hypothetical protein
VSRYPFFLIVDDGGFDHVTLPYEKGKIDIHTYENILKLAKQYEIRIPICFTVKYLDKDNISGVGMSLDYIDELIEFLKNNAKYIEIGYHGLTHEYRNHVGEFFCLDSNMPVSENEQRDHIEKSKNIFDYWGMKFPELFVPPYHAWEEGVTDRILAEYGSKYLVSYKKLKFSNYRYSWNGSQYLTFLPRTSIGLSGEDCELNCNITRKIRFFPNKSIVDFTKSHIIPRGIFSRLRIEHSLIDQPVHSYMTHIGNFSDQALEVWNNIFDYVVNNKRLSLCKSNDDAANYLRRMFSRDG